MGKKKNKNANSIPDTYIEADPVEADEEARKSTDTIPESALGKKLASADKKVRDKAVLVLANWLAKQSSLTEDDHLKIWKALYYCFWMSDKPPVQNELAEKMAEFMHKFPTMEQAVLFFRVFLKTMDREWPGIDRFRLNKFYYLVRCFQRESFVYMARRNWDDVVVDTFNNVLTEGPLSHEAKCADLKLHLADLFLDELANSGTFDSGFSSEILLKLLEPYFQLVVRANDKSVFERGFSRIFESLAGERWLAASLQEDPNQVDAQQLEPLRHTNRMFRHTYVEPVPLRNVSQLFLDRDFAAQSSLQVTARIFSFTVKKSTPEFVRKKFYDLLDEYSELCSGLGQPFEGDVDAVSDEEEAAPAVGDGGDGPDELEPVARPNRSSKGGPATAAAESPSSVPRNKRRALAAAVADPGRSPDGKRARTDKAGRADGPPRAGKDGGAKRSKVKAGRADRAAAAAADAEAARPESAAAAARPESPRRREPGPESRKGRVAGGKEAGAGGAAGKPRPDEDSGATRLTVEERRRMRSRVTALAATSLSESALAAAPTMSPRKHALTAADFFKQEVSPTSRAGPASSSRADGPAPATRPAARGKTGPGPRSASRRGAAMRGT